MVFHKHADDLTAPFESRDTPDVAVSLSPSHTAYKIRQLAGPQQNSKEAANKHELMNGSNASKNELYSSNGAHIAEDAASDAEDLCLVSEARASELSVSTCDDIDVMSAGKDGNYGTEIASVKDADDIDANLSEDDLGQHDDVDREDNDIEDVTNQKDAELRLLSSVDGSIDEISKLDENITINIGNSPSSKRPNHPVDRGYAWVVMIASFCLQFILLGYTKCMGVFFVEFQSRFGASASMMSLVIGVGEGVTSFGAFLVMGLMLKHLTPRTTCAIGTLFLVAGIVANSWLTDVKLLCLTHGIGYGIGMAALFGPSLLVITQYFDKHRALATSIATSGASIGGIVFPLLTRKMLDTYAFQGGILMMAGIVLHAFIFCALLTPIEMYPERRDGDEQKLSEKKKENPSRNILLKLLNHIRALTQRRRRDDVDKENDEACQQELGEYHQKTSHLSGAKCYCNKNGTVCVHHYRNNLETCEEHMPLRQEKDIVVDCRGDLITIPLAGSQGFSLEHFESEIADRPDLKVIEVDHSRMPPKGSSEHLEFRCGPVKMKTIEELKLPSRQKTQHVFGESKLVNKHLQAPMASSAHRFRSSMGSGMSDQTSMACDSSLSVAVEMAELKPAIAQRQLSHLSLSNASIFCSMSSLHTNFADIMSVDQEQFSTTAKQLGLKPVTFFQRFCMNCGQSSLVRSVSFWVLTGFFFFSCIGQAVPQMYIPALAKERGLTDEDAAFFLSLMHMLDFPSRILAGIVVNCGLVKPTTACIVPMLCVGLVGHFTPLMNDYESILALVIIYGIYLGIYFSMQSLVVIEILGLDNFAPSIGFYYLVMGTGGAVSYPISGMLKDSTKTYSTTYHYLATAELLAVILLIVLFVAKRIDLKRGVLKD